MTQSAVIIPMTLRQKNFACAAASIAAPSLMHRATTLDNEPMFEADDGDTK
jgi:hypothetical protein